MRRLAWHIGARLLAWAMNEPEVKPCCRFDTKANRARPDFPAEHALEHAYLARQTAPDRRPT